MRKWLYTIVIASVLLVGITIYLQTRLIEYREVPVHLRVIEGGIGFTTDNDALRFGHIPVGGSAERDMTITSPHDARLIISFSGETAPFASVTQPEILLVAQRPVNVTFYARIPDNTTLGDYNGTAEFYFYRR